MARLTMEQRLAAHREKADQLAEQLRLRTLRNSPAWRATIAAQDKIDEALLALADGGSGEHREALDVAAQALAEIKRKVFAS